MGYAAFFAVSHNLDTELGKLVPNDGFGQEIGDHVVCAAPAEDYLSALDVFVHGEVLAGDVFASAWEVDDRGRVQLDSGFIVVMDDAGFLVVHAETVVYPLDP